MEKKSELQEIPLKPEEEANLLEISKQSGLDISIWKIAGKYSAEKPETLCPWPFRRTYVSSDLRVVPCCMIGNPEISNLGDGTKLAETWKSENYKEFRNDHFQGNIPKYCENCYN